MQKVKYELKIIVVDGEGRDQKSLILRHDGEVRDTDLKGLSLPDQGLAYTTINLISSVATMLLTRAVDSGFLVPSVGASSDGRLLDGV